MSFVVDASVVANWFLPDEYPVAAAAWVRAAEEEVFAPSHWWFEVRNVVLVAERRGRIPLQHSESMLERLDLMSIRDAGRPDQIVTLELSRRHRLTFYDAAYLELARRERIDLATLDKSLAAAARSEGVALVIDR